MSCYWYSLEVLVRLGRSLKHLVELVAELNERDIGLRSLQDDLDTTNSEKRLVLNIFASLAKFEREIISERTNVGLANARARGRLGGRKPGLSQEAKNKARIAESYYKDGMPVNEIAKSLSISQATLYKYLRFRGVEISPYEKHSSS
jgi:DNA invertase Pin-like site-specific DNA recombinase